MARRLGDKFKKLDADKRTAGLLTPDIGVRNKDDAMGGGKPRDLPGGAKNAGELRQLRRSVREFKNEQSYRESEREFKDKNDRRRARERAANRKGELGVMGGKR